MSVIEEIRQSLQTVAQPVASSATLPPACYHDDSWYQQELKTIFRKSWFTVGHQSQWPHIGDYSVVEIGNTPLILIKDENGHLRALSNVCLHRSSTLLTGQGNCRRIVCPFHGWSYETTGAILSAPRMENAQDFLAENPHLPRFNVETHGGFVFVNLDAGARSLSDWLADFDDIHAP